MLLIAAAGYIYYKRKISPDFPGLPQGLTHLDGHAFERASIQNKYLVVSYFQTWCRDCITEIPSLKKLEKSVGKDRLMILLISDEPPEKLQRFTLRFEPGIPVLHSPSLLKDLGIYVYPSTFLVSPQGEILLKKLEGYDWSSDEVAAAIKP